MLDGQLEHCPREGERKKMKRIHIHWHVHIQAGGVCLWGSRSLMDRQTTCVWHETSISHFGLKAAAGFQGWHEGLASEEGNLAPTPAEGPTLLLAPERVVCSPCTGQAMTTHVGGHHPWETGPSQTNPKRMSCLPQSNPPLPIVPKSLSQFAHWNSVWSLSEGNEIRVQFRSIMS